MPLCWCAAALWAAAAGEKPNLLVMVADDLGYADVGFNGGKTIKTPNLDRLAASGIRLTRFYSCPVCSPTRAGLMTGRWPIRFGLMRAVIPPWSTYGLPLSEKTLPQWLAESGYEQRGLIGKWHLGHSRREFLPLARGFTHFYGHYNGAIDYFTHEREGEVDWHRQQATVREEGYTTDLLAAEAARFIRESPVGKPWFLYVPFNAPHSPFQAKPRDLAKYPGLSGRAQTYAAMVDCLDQGVGRILEVVESRSDSANTLVLFFSDNGGVPKVGDNGPLRDGKATVYEGGTRVCAAIRWPGGGLTGGGAFDDQAGYIDVLPTLLAAAGQPPPGNLDGVNLLLALRKQGALPERPWFSYIHQGANAQASVEHRGWKLIAHGDAFSVAPDAKVDCELYRLADDPAEKSDLAGQHPDRVKELRQRMADFGKLQQPGVGPYGRPGPDFKAPKDWIVK